MLLDGLDGLGVWVDQTLRRLRWFCDVKHHGMCAKCCLLLCSLTDEPDANDTITLFVTAFGLQGNAINVEPLLQYDKGAHNLTRANYGQDYTTRINVTGQAPHVPLRCWDRHISTQASALHAHSRLNMA